MARTSPCFYIAPTAISVSPNANGSASDIAVNVVRGAKIKVYSPGVPALGYSDVSFQQWTLAGRNRRLADNTRPYSIYARLAKNNKEDGYLVFAPKVASGTEWLDKYAYVTVGGLATGTANKNSEDYWYVKLGDVSLPTNNARTVTLDTGILGTDKFNTDWNLDPDQMPLRIELSATIESKDAGDRPYVEWGKRLVLKAKLLEGWANANVQRFSHFTIQRNTGNVSADTAYNYPDENSSSEKPSSGRQMPNGLIILNHARGVGDVFNGTVSSTWTVIAWGVKTGTTNNTSSNSASSKSVSSSSSSTSGAGTADQYEMLAKKSINIMAETAEQYTLELSTSVVSYDPSSSSYTPANGVDAMVRATDQKGEVFKLTKAQLEAANLVVQYSIANLDQWNDCKVTSATTDVAKANVPIEAFYSQLNVNVRLVKTQALSTSSSSSSTSSAETSKTTYKEIYRSHIAFIRNGEDSKEREWIFLRSTVELSFAATADGNHKLLPSLIKGGEVKPKEAAAGTDTNKNQDGWVPQGWWDDSLGTNETYLYEYTAYRDYIKDNTSDSSSSGDAAQRGGHWGDFSTPRIWSHYGKDAVTYELEATPSYIKLDADGGFDRSNQYREEKMLLVRGYKIVGGKRITQWGDADNPISIQISFNDGAAWYESTFNEGVSGLDEVYNDFEPTCEDSYFSMLQEMKKNGLKNCKAVMYEGESLDPDKIPSDKVLARLDIPIVQDGKDGASGTSYGVTLTVEKRTISSVEDDCLVVTFTKGDTDGVTTTNNVQDMGGYAQLYVDGKLDKPATARLNLGTSEAGELQKGAFPQVFTAGYVTVKWYDKEGTLLGMGSLTRGADGKDATVYGVQVSSYSEWISSGNKLQGLQFGFTKTTGTTVEKYTDVTKMGCTVKIYGDDTLYDNVSGWINEGNDNFLFSSFPYNNVVGNPTLADKSVISVELYHDDVLLATANYANGKQGALEISVAPDTLVFDTDDDGIVPSGTSKTATIACYRDGKKVTNVEYTLMEGGHPDCSASISTSNSTATVTISNIAKDKTYDVSKTCGTVEVQVYDKDNGRYYFPVVKFAVNVAKFNGGLAADNKKLQSQYKELSNNSATKDDLKQYDSKIEQTARNISLKVMEKSVGRRNLLPGSAFRKQGEGCSIIQDWQDAINGICINGGYDGTNCVRLRNESPNAYLRISWDGARNSNVKVEKGRKYTHSFWAKRLSSQESGYEISTQFFLQDGANGYARPYGAVKFGSFTVKSQGEWEFIQDTVTIPSDAKANYMEVCICLGITSSGGYADILVCRPMLEEGEEYNGWTLSEQDYDYVGGNLLDNAGTLTKSGNVERLNPDNVKQGGMGESASIKAVLSPTEKENDFLQFSTDGMGLKANEDYVLSFYAKADSNPGRLLCFLYPSEGGINTEDSDGKYDNTWETADGRLKYGIVPGTQWKRYWVHWRPTKADPKHVLFRLSRGGNDRGTYSSYTTYAVDDVVLYDGTYYRCIKAGQGNTPSSSSSYWDATRYQISLSQPKLEVGATVTEWTAKRSDMVDKQALYATGIDLDSKTIILTAKTTKFRDNDGNEQAVIDGNGLRAGTIATTDNGGGHTEISGNTTVWYNKDGVTPGIKVFYDAAGVPHFQFCNSNGKVMYDFGPSGLQSFISSTQQAYSDECYLRSASSSVSTSGTKLSFDWLYVARNQSADLRYLYRKQIPTTSASSASEIYDGCVFTSKHKYEGTDWPATSTSLANSRLLPNGWYVEPNDGNLPMKIRPADDEGVFDPTQTVYYQTFYYYSSGKVTRTVRAYMKRTTSSQLASKFTYAGSYDEI